MTLFLNIFININDNTKRTRLTNDSSLIKINNLN